MTAIGYLLTIRKRYWVMKKDSSGDGANRPLDEKGFDKWVDSYDLDVSLTDGKNEYPFEAYAEVVSSVIRLIKAHPGKKVLDCGIGTGALSKVLYHEGYQITGIDFSTKMLAKCRESMPAAKLIHHDFSQAELPAGLDRYHAILFTYSIHHFDYDVQFSLIRRLVNHLNPGGMILIGDVMTKTLTDMQTLANNYGELWDDAETYPIAEVYRQNLPEFRIRYEAKSASSGIITLSK